MDDFLIFIGQVLWNGKKQNKKKTTPQLDRDRHTV